MNNIRFYLQNSYDYNGEKQYYDFRSMIKYRVFQTKGP